VVEEHTNFLAVFLPLLDSPLHNRPLITSQVFAEVPSSELCFVLTFAIRELVAWMSAARFARFTLHQSCAPFS